MESTSWSIFLIGIIFLGGSLLVCFFFFPFNLTGGDIVNVYSVRITWCAREQCRNLDCIEKSGKYGVKQKNYEELTLGGRYCKNDMENLWVYPLAHCYFRIIASVIFFEKCRRQNMDLKETLLFRLFLLFKIRPGSYLTLEIPVEKFLKSIMYPMTVTAAF